MIGGITIRMSIIIELDSYKHQSYKASR